MKLKEGIAKRILELKDQYQLSTHQLSLATSVANSTLVDIINEKYDTVQLKHILSICQGLKISFLEFFDVPYLEPKNLDIQ